MFGFFRNLNLQGGLGVVRVMASEGLLEFLVLGLRVLGFRGLAYEGAAVTLNAQN